MRPPPPPLAQLQTQNSRDRIRHLLNSRCATPGHVLQILTQLTIQCLSSDTALASPFINVCHSLGLSHLTLQFFAHLPCPRPHVFICNTLIRAFALSRTPQVPFSVYSHMHRNSVLPNNFTFTFLLKSLADHREFRQGLCVHTHVAKMGHLEDIYVGNSLLNLYASGDGDMALCRQLFDEMLWRDVVSWTILIAGYRNGCKPGDALFAFEQMLHAGIEPNHVTMVNALAACSGIGAIEMGMWIHDFLRRKQWDLDVILGTALVGMYIRCKKVDEGLKVFNSMEEKSVFTWNVVIKGLAHARKGNEAVSWFSRMEREGVKVNEETLVAVLSACTHSRLIDKGREIFNDLLDGKFGIYAGIKHYTCAVYLLACAGCLEDAFELIKQMPFNPTKAIWEAVLAGCRAYGNPTLSELAAKKVVELEQDNGADNVGAFLFVS